jgi:hypothetical protein
MGQGEGSVKTNPLDYPSSHTCDMPLDDLIPRCAEHQRAPVVYRGEQRIAVFEAVLEVDECFVELLDEPFEFASLWWRRRFNQHPRRINCSHFKDHATESKGRVVERVWTYLGGLDGGFKLVGSNGRPDFD